VLYKETGTSTPGVRTGDRSSFDWIRSLIPSFRRAPAKEVALPQSEPIRKRARYGAPETPEWLTELEERSNDPDFETTLKTDIFIHRVFVFTPRGDAVDLPINSSPIDFAYAIHSDVGDHISGAKVNGKMVPLDTTLQNGDIVEIQTKKSAAPTQKWLGFAKTTLARRHIRNALERLKGKIS